MAFSIMLEKNLEKQLQKVVKKQLFKAIEETQYKESKNKAVHQIRKRCKKLRGLLKMGRYGFKDTNLYKDKNESFKCIANTLSGARDKKVLGDTYTHIVKRYNLDWEKYIDIAKSIEELKDDEDTKSIDAVLKDVNAMLHTEVGDLKRYRLEKNRYKDIEKGIKKSYKKARNFYKNLLENPDAELFHEFRKWVKYHMYQMQLVRKNADCLLNARVNRLKLLSDILGQEHDITVFKQYFQSVSLSYEEEFESYLNQEQQYLRRVTYEIAQELFCAPPKKFISYLNATFAV